MMQRALDEARHANPSPNPAVGAVVVAPDGQILALGHHVRAGEEHAEVVALAAAGEAARGATLYVTLEPCNHHGRTPPCVDAIIEAGLSRVVIGCLDPNPTVPGGGARRLQDAGIEVEIGALNNEARDLIAAWAKHITTGLPHVALKLALSLDGRIATRTGASKWVTGPEARSKVQELRAQRDAVAVGIGTALSDDPRLTVRDTSLLLSGKAPLRVIFDTNLRIPIGSRVVETARETHTWVIAGPEAPEAEEAALVDAGVTVLRVPVTAEGRVDVRAALRALGESGVASLLVEGGAELAGSLLAARLADELHAFIAPVLLGPRGRPGAVDWAGPDTPVDAPRIVDPVWELCGSDAYVHGKLLFPSKV